MITEQSITEFLHMIIRQTPAEQWYGDSMARYRIGENVFWVKFDDNYRITEISHNDGPGTVMVVEPKCTLFHESED